MTDPRPHLVGTAYSVTIRVDEVVGELLEQNVDCLTNPWNRNLFRGGC